MKKNDYFLMLFQDNETESMPKKEVYEAVLECTVEALSQTADSFEIDGNNGLPELFAEIEKIAKSGKTQCVSPFRAAELIAAKLGATYTRPINKLRAVICGKVGATSELDFDDFI